MITDAHHHLWEYNTEVMHIPRTYFADFKNEDKEKIFRTNCIDFYGLQDKK